MPYLFVGAGQAGSSIVDEIFAHKNMEQIATPLIFNSTIRDMQKLQHVGRDRWYGVAEGTGFVPAIRDGFEEQVTGGFGRNPVRADDVVEENRAALEDTIRDELTAAEDESETNVPFAFVFCGLGGGTGNGLAPHVIDVIEEYTDGTAEIIAVCVLPNTQGPVGGEEASPSRQAWNTRYGLNRLEEAADGIVLVDNQRLAYHEAAEGQFTDLNEYVAASLVDLVSGPVLERIDPSEYAVDPPVIDLQDIVTSLSFGIGADREAVGYASLGRSVQMTRSLPGYLLPYVGRRSVEASALSHLSELKQTLEGVDTQEARKAIGLLRAPPSYISATERQIDTSRLRAFLTARCDEVNLGATLTERHLASFTTVFTYRREDIDRLSEIESLASEYEREFGAVGT